MSATSPITCACTGDQHARSCDLWTARSCECDPLGEGLDHERWCGQHPAQARLDIDHEPSPRRMRPAPPPPCITCSRFVNVRTARKIAEYGDYGALLNVEFECERCVAVSAAQTEQEQA